MDNSLMREQTPSNAQVNANTSNATINNRPQTTSSNSTMSNTRTTPPHIMQPPLYPLPQLARQFPGHQFYGNFPLPSSYYPSQQRSYLESVVSSAAPSTTSTSATATSSSSTNASSTSTPVTSTITTTTKSNNDEPLPPSPMMSTVSFDRLLDMFVTNADQSSSSSSSISLLSTSSLSSLSTLLATGSGTQISLPLPSTSSLSSFSASPSFLQQRFFPDTRIENINSSSSTTVSPSYESILKWLESPKRMDGSQSNENINSLPAPFYEPFNFNLETGTNSNSAVEFLSPMNPFRSGLFTPQRSLTKILPLVMNEPSLTSSSTTTNTTYNNNNINNISSNNNNNNNSNNNNSNSLKREVNEMKAVSETNTGEHSKKKARHHHDKSSKEHKHHHHHHHNHSAPKDEMKSLSISPSSTNNNNNNNSSPLPLPAIPTLATIINAPTNRFVLKSQPNTHQRKSYRSESRYLMPNPLIVHLKDPTNFADISSGVVVVSLLDGNGRELPENKKDILDTPTPEGKTQQLSTKYYSAGFSVKVLENSGATLFRLKFDVTYVTSDGQEHKETVISDPFIVQSNKKFKKNQELINAIQQRYSSS